MPGRSGTISACTLYSKLVLDLHTRLSYLLYSGFVEVAEVFKRDAAWGKGKEE